MLEQAASSKIDFHLKYPDLFTAIPGTITQVQVPKLQFLTTTGRGSPDDELFQSATQGLHGIAFALKFRIKRKRISGFTDYLMPPIEAIRDHREKSLDQRTRKALLLQPVTITSTLLHEVIDIASFRHPDSPLPEIKLETYSEGSCVQTLHAGSYALLEKTEEALRVYGKKNNLALSTSRHEIYLNDPRKTKEKDLQTIIRISIKQ